MSSSPPPDKELEIYSHVHEGVRWRDFREKLLEFAASPKPHVEQALLATAKIFRAGQDQRKLFLSDRGCPEDLTAIKMEIRGIERYRDGLAKEVDALKKSRISPKFLELFEEEIQYSDDVLSCLGEELRAKGGSPPVSPAAAIAAQITSKMEVKMEIKRHCDELKGRSPEEFWADIDRACRQAIEQLDK